MDNVPESYVDTENDRYVLNILNYRTNRVRARTRIIDRQHGILDKYDCKIKNSGIPDMTSPKSQNYLEGPKLDRKTGAPTLNLSKIRHVRQSPQLRLRRGVAAFLLAN